MRRIFDALRHALGLTLARPHLVAVLLLINLLASWVLVLPLLGLLGAELDHNLYGERMADGVSWRWVDTVTRKHPRALGNLDAGSALVSERGLGLGDLRALAGPPAAVALAALVLVWVNSLAHCGFLATLGPERRGFGAATARLALPASALAAVAVVLYAGAYGLLYVASGYWLSELGEAVGRQWVTLALTWGRLGLTLAALVAIKAAFDLSKVVLVERDTWNWPWAGILALRELVSHAGRYLALYLLLALATPALALAWALSGGRIVAGGWLGLAALFLLHQLFLGARITLRLTRLAAVRHLYLTAERPPKPPYKVEPAGEG